MTAQDSRTTGGRGRLFDSVIDTIGDTPCIRINNLAPENVTVYVKAEFFNPAASVKDRLADGTPAEGHAAWEPHPIQGWTPDFIPLVLQESIDNGYYDELIPVPGPVGIEWSQKLAQQEGVFTGISGGSTFAIAMQIAEQAEPGSVILAMLPDTGERYLSSPLFETIEEYMTDEEEAISKSTPAAQMPDE